MTKTVCFWDITITENRIRTSPIEVLPSHVDVAILGGGYTGLAAARTLAQRGGRVAVLEAETLGWGASSRNGGQVLTGMKLSMAEIVRRYGMERAQRWFSASLAAIDWVEQIVKAENIACDFRRCGHLELACKPQHYAHYEHYADYLNKHFKHSIRLLPKNQQHTEIGSDYYHGLFIDDLSAGVNPAQYVNGLALAAQKAGALLFEHARVTEIKREGGAYQLQTARGPLKAEKVFVATSGYTGSVTPTHHKRIVPIGSYIIATEPLSESVARNLSPHQRMMFDSKNFLYYFRLSADNRMLFGGRAAFMPESTQIVTESAEILRQGMVDVYPQLCNAKVEYVWGGTLDFAFDFMPHAGQLDGLYYALGYAGHGVALATYLGHSMALTILGQADANPYADLSFPTAPLGLYAFVKPLLPFVGWWYRWLDWIG